MDFRLAIQKFKYYLPLLCFMVRQQSYLERVVSQNPSMEEVMEAFKSVPYSHIIKYRIYHNDCKFLKIYLEEYISDEHKEIRDLLNHNFG